MIIDGPIHEDPDDARYGYRITDVPNEDADLLPEGDILGEWVRVGSSVTPKGPDHSQLHEKFIRKDEDPAQLAYENGRREGYTEAMKDMANREFAKIEDELEALRDAVIIAARAYRIMVEAANVDAPEMTDWKAYREAEKAVDTAFAALDAKTGYKP